MANITKIDRELYVSGYFIEVYIVIYLLVDYVSYINLVLPKAMINH